MFYKCPKSREEGQQCPFFQWEDEPPRMSSPGKPYGGGYAAGSRGVTSPGAGGGGGGSGACFKCGQVVTTFSAFLATLRTSPDMSQGRGGACPG